jgi:hypothetical protein
MLEFFDATKVGSSLATMAAKKVAPGAVRALATAPTLRGAMPQVAAMRPSFWGGGGLRARAAANATPLTAAAKPGARAAAAPPAMGVLGGIGSRVAQGAQAMGIDVTGMANRLADFHARRGAGAGAGVKALRTIGGGAVAAGGLAGAAGVSAMRGHDGTR